jgi:hypothetical protein
MLNKYNLIDDCIKIASNYDGKVFGGYLRDVIISKISNPRRKCEFKDVDIWFKTDIDSILFINDMKDIYDFRIVPELSIDNDNPHYQFNRTQYHLFIENIVIWFDIVISECFPVDDFDVNFLTYCYKNDKELVECESKYFDKDQLINSINKKQMIMLPDYIQRLIIKSSTDVHVSRINKRFLSKGWIIKYKNTYFPRLLTTLWIYQTFGCMKDGSNLIYIKDKSSNCSVDFQKNDESFECKDKLEDNSNNCIIS